MKWGKRKAVSSSPSDDYTESRAIKKKPISELSNKELKALTTRMDLEKKYNQLNPKVTARGKAVVTGIISTAGLAFSLYNMYNHPATKKIIQTGKAALAVKSPAAAAVIPDPPGNFFG